MTTPLTVTNVIDGKAVNGSSGEIRQIFNPSTGEVLTQLNESTVEDGDRAVAAARAAFPAWAARTPGARSELLHRLVEVIEENIDDLARLETLDAGKPTTVARGEELPGIAAALRHFAGAARTLAGQAAGEFVENNTSYVRREPLGVVLGITPWNFPLWQAVWKLGPALAAGNTVVIKPAELTPLATTRFVELAQEVLPAGVLNVVHGTGGVIGDALVRHPEVNLVSFTGSTAAGRTIAAAAGGAPKRLILELGGNAPVIIYDDIDLQAALPILTNGVLFNAGQECMSSTRLLVSEKVHDQFVTALANSLQAAKVGDASDPETVLGPLISQRQLDRVVKLVDGRLLLRTHADHRREPGRRTGAGGDLWAGGHRADLHRRSRRDRQSQRRRSRAGGLGVDARHRPCATHGQRRAGRRGVGEQPHGCRPRGSTRRI
jgi:acyl-CoA reductase-like NAD-dependent aldehyde dehydrogenase